ncbi:MAG: long-chain-fatty-acid--CoA ligase [Bacillaceae bacterium]|nr:long-chain-fatty-acid--CoA ligase [Bacillaceae bacterium]
MSTTIGDLVQWSARNYPDKLAVVYPRKDQRWTYAEFNEKISRFASALKNHGVRKGDVVSTFLYNTSEFAVALFAAARLGAIFNPINYRLSAHELQYILNDAKSRVVLFEGAVKDTIFKTRDLGTSVDLYIYVDEDVPEWASSYDQLLEQGSNNFEHPIVDENDYYIMMYTSGTTGRPKGVVHRHRHMVHHSLLMMQCMGLTKDDIGLTVAPLNHTAELHTSFLPRVMVGATNVILHEFKTTEVLETIEKEKITHIFAAPTMVNMLLNDPEFDRRDFSTVRLLGYGGASMAPVLIKEFQRRTNSALVQMLGTTEMGPVFTVLFADEQLVKAGSAGKPILTHDVRVVRLQPDGSPSRPDDVCDVDEIGEIIVRGPCMMVEYYNRPEATEKAMAYGWYHTGDMGYVDEDGYIWVKDRMDFMINSGAENIYPREVEDQLLEHPDVLEVAVVGQPDPKWGKIVVACIVPRTGSGLNAEQLDEFLLKGERIARYKRPRKYLFMDSLPKTPSGKIQKFILEEQLKKLN